MQLSSHNNGNHDNNNNSLLKRRICVLWAISWGFYSICYSVKLPFLSSPSHPQQLSPRFFCSVDGTVAELKVVHATELLLLNVVRGQEVERPPVWLMRPVGRYMKSYQLLCEKYPSLRERLENVDLVVEISLQPWKVFRPDGVILFSDILTHLSRMNIPFDIIKGKGPIIFDPLWTATDVDQVKEFSREESAPYIGEALMTLRKEVNNEAAVLGFVGAPFTLASYVVEGGSSKHFTKIKRLAFSQPKVLHMLLQKLATSMAKYIQYQADKGARAVQIFDSWATELSPVDFEEFSLPYLKQIVETVKQMVYSFQREGLECPRRE